MTRLWQLMRTHRGSAALAAVLEVVGVAASLAQPLAVSRLVSTLQSGGDLWPTGLLLGLLFIISGFLAFLGAFVVGRMAESIVADLRRRLVSRIACLTVSELESRGSGDFVSRVSSDTSLVKVGVTTAPLSILRGTIGVAGSMVLMALVEWRLLVVTVASLALTAIAAIVVMPKVRDRFRRYQVAVGELGAAVEKVVSSTRLVKSACAENDETRRMYDNIRSARSEGVHGAFLHSILAATGTLGAQLPFLACLTIGGAMVATGAMDVAALVGFILYVFYLVGPVQDLVQGFSTFNQSLGALDRIAEIDRLAIEHDVHESITSAVGATPVPSSSKPDAAGPAAVDFLDVSYRYPGTTTPAVEHVTIRCPPGRVTALVGSSGSGKSTLLTLLMRFRDPDDGVIHFDGTPTTALTRPDLRRAVAYVDQESLASHGTVRDNLRIPSGTDDAEVAELLRDLGLGTLATRREALLDEEIGMRGLALSGGERQRFALARALLQRPRLLILDEATSQLDGVNERAFQDVVARAARRCTVLVVAHRISTVAEADQIVVLDAGAVRASGTHDELVSSDSVYRDLAIQSVAFA